MIDAIEMAVVIVICAWMLLGTRSWIERAQGKHDRRLADRMARGHDAYFEELRSLQTYNPVRKIWAVRLIGGAGLLFSASYLISQHS